MNENRIVQLLAALKNRAPREPDWIPSIAEQDYGFQREITACLPPVWAPPSGTVENARLVMWNAIVEYLDDPLPEHILLIRATPGTGKTTAAVRAIEQLTTERVAYAGPRHDFYADVVSKSGEPEKWYEWQPRQLGDDEKPETCRYTPEINQWMKKGYDGMDFCSGVCGWDYVNEHCPYHQQKKRSERVIFVQYQHVSLGHPMKFKLLVGDENPVSAFMHAWTIPAEHIFPAGMDFTEPLTEILYDLQTLASDGVLSQPMQGTELLDTMGGAESVFAAVEGFKIPAEALAAGAIHSANQVDLAPYFHLPRLVELLTRESYNAISGNPYAERIMVDKHGLTLLLRREISEMPNHVIWLDATAQPEIYQELFNRPVKTVEASAHLNGNIYQVVNRANGKGALLKTTKSKNGEIVAELTQNADQAKQMVDKIIADKKYQSPVAMTFKLFSETITDIDSGHFYAARGTNQFEHADAVFVIGAPMAAGKAIVEMAKMIFFERDDVFLNQWSAKPAPYNYIDPIDSHGRQYPVSSFWGDRDLTAVLKMLREEEILQAAHRGRPVNHPVDIWLLTNIPIDALPPDELLTIRDVMRAPEGVDVWKWGKMQKLIDVQDVITKSDIMELGFSENTAGRYFGIISSMDGWEIAAIKTGKRGMPPKSLKKC